ncbi:MAG: restriction endonuclease subunit S, partial [Anaerolineales bacterium]|nr:restriction endonuclease subunit S [Anaerolineales bacterium]
TAKTRRLDSLRAALLFGGLRLDGQRRNWEPRRLAEVTHELTARNGDKAFGRDAVMGVTKANGIVPMREQTIAGDISRYKVLPPRAFAYNPMRINVGSIAMNEGKAEVLVSPDYVVFGCNDGGLDPDYLDHLRKTRWWGHYINSGGSGSVRMRTYYDDLAAMKLPLPELDEQREIIRILNTARDDLTITEKEIQALNRQKRGLMQKLLTGEWRVKVEAE